MKIVKIVKNKIVNEINENSAFRGAIDEIHFFVATASHSFLTKFIDFVQMHHHRHNND